MNDNKVLCKFKQLENLIIRKFEEDLSINTSVPTFTQIRIMKYMLDHDNECIYQKELEEVLHLRRATVSGVLQTMEKNDLISRIVSNEDARTKKIILKKSAKELFFYGYKKLEQMEKVVTFGLNDKEIKLFLNVLDKMSININNYKV